MCAAIKWTIRSTAPNIGLEEISFRLCALQASNGCRVYLAVLVVGLVELDDHVPLFAVVADAGYVAVFAHVGARERIE